MKKTIDLLGAGGTGQSTTANALIGTASADAMNTAETETMNNLISLNAAPSA